MIILPEIVFCSVCQKESLQYASYWNNSFTLDPYSRLKTHNNSTSLQSNKGQRCPDCGYCSTDISIEVKAAASRINEQDYRHQLNNIMFPLDANSFLCKAMLERHADRFYDAACSSMYAWLCCVCEPDYHDQAIDCSEWAVNVIFESGGKEITEEDPLVEILILVDHLRMAGHFIHAATLIDWLSGVSLDGILTGFLNKQRELVDMSITQIFRPAH